MKLTVLMPCLNEEETLEVCITKAQNFMKQAKINGEVLIADNGSTDNSIKIAEKLGARVVHVEKKGYGAALGAGIKAAKGKYVIMGDSDDSYDFSDLSKFIEKLDEGHDLVMGNRFRGGIAKGAMPPLHRFLGNPVLSFIGNLFFKTPAKDFHCGLRGFSRKAIRALDLQTTGMEFASEMVVKATIADLKVTEVPTTLSKDGRSRPPHLKSWRDGWRHLRFLLMFSPKWLFWIPAAILLLCGISIFGLSFYNHITSISDNIIGEHWMFLATALLQVAHLSFLIGAVTHFYSIKKGIRNFKAADQMFLKVLDFNVMVLGGTVLVLLGLTILGAVFANWLSLDFVDPNSILPTATGILACVIGAQNIFGGFILAVIADFDAEMTLFKEK